MNPSSSLALILLILTRKETLALQSIPSEGLLRPSAELLSRRTLISSVASTAILFTSTISYAETNDRSDLLRAISRKASDEEVIGIIENLQDPSGGKATFYPDRLEGQWELIWSYKAEAFSPLLKLPEPFRPESYQYLGSAAAQEVGDGRIAQGLTGGILGKSQLWLSSGAVPFEDDPSVLEIQPPFRFQLGGKYGSGVPKKMIVESGSDAEFRQVNGRSKEEQAAGKNQYQQMYLENIGPGSLRVSSVIAGDPVIVGEIFVHRKL
ncbi:predicted protein [Phaeodactylum tricornutum CCAP 1055/1]|jgi:hypothetical protein|uniref:Plastid lipid-associated protein/fibrillin conserved domain-containing protein n=1 Tax=Phaeodactylum tricornutum (strain CCAP 1055/1) TaxID=556484 RepID=B7GCZ4_PHATC|nr:predicted protein [Phaeodactylum tricornutum CCAP 1055/1]EEC43408.1 predicted protein [Phaeodactylum tricornutum CCAP 1055/1]|eukprot:XP_002184961.1 predicted protein [Phaeodactylum tricornutum CCAP 1055/1]